MVEDRRFGGLEVQWVEGSEVRNVKGSEVRWAEGLGV